MSKLKFKVDEVSQEFDLKKVFGTKAKITDDIKAAFGQAVIDKILDRTAEGKDVNGRAFKKYSKDYAESLAFKAAGKSEGDVNMSQHGDMLGLLDITEEKGSKIKVGWDDDLQNAKAFYHNKDAKTTRKFFGINKGELAEIKRELKPLLDPPSKIDREKELLLARGMELLAKVKKVDVIGDDE